MVALIVLLVYLAGFAMQLLVRRQTAIPFRNAARSQVHVGEVGASALQFSEKLVAEEFSTKLNEHLSSQDRMLRAGLPVKQCIIYRCRMDDELCGGVGDRMYGILVLYLAAILTKRSFFIYNSKPVPLEQFLLPNKLDWRIDSIKHKKSRDDVLSCAEGSLLSWCTQHVVQIPFRLCKYLKNLVFSSYYFLNINDNMRTDCIEELLYEFDSLRALTDRSQVDSKFLHDFATNISRMMMDTLFRPHQRLIDTAMTAAGKNVQSQPHDCLVCVHVRTGYGLGERTRHRNMSSFASCAGVAKRDLLVAAPQCAGNLQWLLVGDNQDALDMLQILLAGAGSHQFLRTKHLGSSFHIDKGQNASAGMLHAYTDWYLLTKCRYLVASMSTMGATAALHHGPAVSRYDVEVANRTNTCKCNSIYDWQRDANAELERLDGILT